MPGQRMEVIEGVHGELGNGRVVVGREHWRRGEICARRAAVASRHHPTHRKKRDEWGTQSMGDASGAVEKQIPRAALRNDKQKQKQILRYAQNDNSTGGTWSCTVGADSIADDGE
ncbi:MAG TPA: hypothetical protein VGB94_08625 [Acidobacteriaceae bacterium]